MLTSFIGRETEILELQKKLDEVRLLTLVGAPGIGKTRLGWELSSRLADRYRSGVCTVELASITDPSLTAQRVATALEVPDSPGRSVEDALVDRLAGEELLLLLDNCEHVTDAAAALVARVLADCPGVDVLATSRTGLALSGEQVWAVPPLELWSGVQLFRDRAQLVSPTVRVESQADIVKRICHRLDGLPLAIELAAALTRVLSPEEILGRLDGSLPLLRSASRDVNPRQQTMEATVDWSYQLLEAPEQQLFERLSVFAGGFDLAAAEAVSPLGEVLGPLTTLIDHSLVLAHEGSTGRTRYRLLEPVRYCSQARLAERDEREATRRRHAEHYVQLALQLEGDLRTDQVRTAVTRFNEEDGNFRTALDFARSQPDDLGLRLCTALGRSWALRRRVNEGQAWFDEMLQVETSDQRLRASALARASRLAWLQQDATAAERLLEESLAVERELGDELRVARRIRSLAAVHMACGDHHQAGRLLDESIAICRASSDDDGLALALAFASFGCRLAGMNDKADSYLHEALELGRTSGNVLATGYSLAAAVFGAILTGDTPALRAHVTETLTRLRGASDLNPDRSWLWAGLALASAEGRYRAAARIGAAVEAAAQHAGVRSHFPSQFMDFLRPSLERARAEVPAAELARLGAEGRRMTLAELTDQALATSEVDDHTPLSFRESEIAELVAQRLTNIEIAERLVLSKRTVETHVAHIRAKLGVARRSEIGAWVREGRHPDDPGPGDELVASDPARR